MSCRRTRWYRQPYDRALVRPTLSAVQGSGNMVDGRIIDGAVNGVARAIAWGGWSIRLTQSGQTQHYALGMTLGAVVILITVYLLF